MMGEAVPVGGPEDVGSLLTSAVNLKLLRTNKNLLTEHTRTTAPHPRVSRGQLVCSLFYTLPADVGGKGSTGGGGGPTAGQPGRRAACWQRSHPRRLSRYQAVRRRPSDGVV